MYRLLTRQTAEATMFRVASKKLGLTNILLNGLHSRVSTNTSSAYVCAFYKYALALRDGIFSESP